MLDIQNLERRWLKYKIKSFAPYIIAISLFGSALFATFYYWLDSGKTEPAPMQKHFQAPPQQTPEKINSTNVPSSAVLEPSMDFVQSLQTSIAPAEPSKPSEAKNVKSIQPTPPPKVLNVPESTSLKAPVPSPLQSDKTLSLNRNDSKIDIESLERRFKETSNPNLGVFIARYYYDHGNYSESYNFALKTNGINNTMDESWIIFSKSLIKLGKVEQAKKTLQLYVSESNSESARSLLDSIERGSFK